MVGAQQVGERCMAIKDRLRVCAVSILMLVKFVLASTYLLDVSLYQPT
jgi:hypothetical protein